LSSDAVNSDIKDSCFETLRKVSLARGILPKSYHLPQVTLSDTVPYASGVIAVVWKGQLDGRQVCIKAFLIHEAAYQDKIKRVRSRVPNRG
jgi:hypothetical protein